MSNRKRDADADGCNDDDDARCVGKVAAVQVEPTPADDNSIQHDTRQQDSTAAAQHNTVVAIITDKKPYDGPIHLPVKTQIRNIVCTVVMTT